MTSEAAPIACFLLKVASRCNLACDYCYMYEHADQSWRSQPRVMSLDTVRALGTRLADYVNATGVSRIAIVFHGGEPLLAGASVLASYAAGLREAVGDACRLDFSLQTNGLLLTEPVLDALASADIAVSLSLDGPAEANDRHRTRRSGASSFDATVAALRLLQGRPSQFTGVIAVIDADVEPEQLFEFFDPMGLPSLDFLLPDANHLRPPVGREQDADRYLRWLVRAFDLWFDRYPHVPVRTFDAVLAAIAGKPSGTDAFGLGDVSLLTIETDGTYHDLDVLKITAQGATALGGSVFDTPIEAVARSPRVAAHRALLRLDGLSAECQACPEAVICGGGAVPHRYDFDGFGHPSVYCRELLSLISHARRRLQQELVAATVRHSETLTSSLPPGADRADAGELEAMVDVWRASAAKQMYELASEGERIDLDRLSAVERAALAISPPAHLWRRLKQADRDGRSLKSIGGLTLTTEAGWLSSLVALTSRPLAWPRIHRLDPMLRAPFEGPIEFIGGEELEVALPLVLDAIQIIEQYDSTLIEEMRAISPEIQLIRDPSADPDKVVSFSDDLVPGALYVAPFRRRRDLLSVWDVADSLIHEHRHQKLYLVDRISPLVDRDWPEVNSPWREDPRPPSGLLHAVYVFVELRRFWRWVGDESIADNEARVQAHNLLERIDQQLASALPTLRGCQLSRSGFELLGLLEERLG